MSILDGVAGLLIPRDARRAMLELRAAAAANQLAPGRINKPVWGKHHPTAYQDDAYLKIALIFRCVGVTAQSAAKASLRVREERADGTELELPNHGMRRLMRRPNGMMGENRFLAMVYMMASVAGFCLIEKERSPDGNVIALWPLEPHRCTPILQNQAAPSWEYKVPGLSAPIKLPARDVIVYTYADRPDMKPTGVGPIEVAFREVGIVNIMTDFLKAFFDAGAAPQHGLLLEEDRNGRMNPEKADDIKRKYMRRYGGLMRSIEPAILEGIKDIKRLSFDMNELAYKDIRDIADVAICNAFGLSPLLVDAMAGLARSTYSNKDDARKGFYDETISTLWSRLDDELTLGLLNEFEPDYSTVSLYFDTSKIKALQDDRDKKAAWVSPAVTGGWLSVHTGHRELSIPVPAGPDFYLRAINLEAVPVDDPFGERAAAGNAAADEQLEDGTRRARASATTTPALGPGTMLALGAGLGMGPAEIRATIGLTNREHQRRIADKATPWLRTFFREQGQRILAAHQRGALVDPEQRELRGLDDIGWSTTERKALESVLARLFTLSGEIAFDQAATQLGMTGLSFDLANPNVAKVRELLAHQVVDITETSRKQVQSIVTDGLNAGKLIPEITKDLQAAFEGWTKARARTVARTESMLSYGHASLAGYRESGVVDRVQCFDNESHTEKYGAEDGLSCADRDGLIAPLADGEKHLRSEHPNGSLSLAPVLEGDD